MRRCARSNAARCTSGLARSREQASSKLWLSPQIQQTKAHAINQRQATTLSQLLCLRPDKMSTCCNGLRADAICMCRIAPQCSHPHDTNSHDSVQVALRTSINADLVCQMLGGIASASGEKLARGAHGGGVQVCN